MIKEKETLRAGIKRLRSQASASNRALWSRTIMNYLLEDLRFEAAETVMAYASMNSEVATDPLLQFILDQGKTLVLPRCVRGAPRFEPVAVDNLKRDLHKGPLPGLKDPHPSLPVRPRTPPLDIVLVPGLAFDARGYRLGYGKGMYDRFLADYRPNHTIGLAFSLQLVPRVPVAAHDIPLDRLLTERGWLPA